MQPMFHLRYFTDFRLLKTQHLPAIQTLCLRENASWSQQMLTQKGVFSMKLILTGAKHCQIRE